MIWFNIHEAIEKKLSKEMNKSLNHLIGRSAPILETDVHEHEVHLRRILGNSNVLVLDGSGTIGQVVTMEIFKRNPRKLHVVDISVNKLVELVRDIKISLF